MIFTNLHELIPSWKCKEFHSLGDQSPFQFKIKVTLDVVNTRTKQLRKRNNSFSKYDCNKKKGLFYDRGFICLSQVPSILEFRRGTNCINWLSFFSMTAVTLNACCLSSLLKVCLVSVFLCTLILESIETGCLLLSNWGRFALYAFKGTVA